MNKKIYLSLGACALILVVIGFTVKERASEPKEDLDDEKAPIGLEVAPVASGDIKEFSIAGKNFGYEPASITVKKGDLVKITFVDDEGFHDLVIEGLNVATKRIQTGESETIEFTADQTGSFAYYCSVGKHRENGMEGTLIVE